MILNLSEHLARKKLIDGIMTDIPIINIKETGTTELRHACEDLGCFFVKQERLDSLLPGVIEEAKRFFSLSESTKQRFRATPESYFVGYRPNGSEKNMHGTQDEHCDQFKIGMMKENSKGFKSVEKQLESPAFNTQKTQHYWERSSQCADLILKKLEASLGFEQHYFDPFFNRPLHQLGLNYYPGISEKLAAPQVEHSLSAHVDLSLFTLISQDQPGLQIRIKDQIFTEVGPREDAVLVLVGEYLHRWSGGRYKAPMHRVSTSEQLRYSVVYKHRPNYDAVIQAPYRSANSGEVRVDPYHTGKAYDRKIYTIMGAADLLPNET